MGIVSGYDIFCGEFDEVQEYFPKLRPALYDGKKVLEGELDVIDRDGKLWDSYSIEVHHSQNYPYKFPLLFEVGGIIPKIGDWHIYEDTKSCCVKVLPEEFIICKNGITLVGFIQNEVLPYLFNQTHRRIEGYYVNGEYSHGILGIYEFYSRILGTGSDYRKTLSLMLYAAENLRPGRTSLCFCGSGNKFRKCHRTAFDHLTTVGAENLKVHAHMIAKAAGFL